MKKIFVLIVCVLLVCAMPLVTLANGADVAADGETDISTENATPEKENATEGEISGVETEEKSMIDSIIDYVKVNYEEFTVIATLIVGIIYKKRRDCKLDGCIGTLNNNAVTIAEKSTAAVKNIATELQTMKSDFSTLLAEYRDTAEEKKSLEEKLETADKFLQTAKLALIALSNEVANLIVLSNIPNAIKDRLTETHMKAINDVAALEVTEDDGNKA